MSARQDKPPSPAYAATSGRRHAAARDASSLTAEEVPDYRDIETFEMLLLEATLTAMKFRPNFFAGWRISLRRTTLIYTPAAGIFTPPHAARRAPAHTLFGSPHAADTIEREHAFPTHDFALLA